MFDQQIASRTGAGLMALAAVLCLVQLAAAGGVQAAPLGSALAGLLLALVLTRHSRRWTSTAAALGSALLVAVAIAAADGGSGAEAALFVPVGVYAAYFVGGRAVILTLAVIAVSYAAALRVSATASPALDWAVILLIVSLTTALVRRLREVIRELLVSLDEAARRDALTGLLNRRGITERLEQELARSARSGTPVTVVVGDLDRFKALNDTLGHTEGDRALERVAALLSSIVRRTDVVGRLGGDEFVVVLPDTDAAEAAAQTARTAAALADAFAADPVPIAITFGSATARAGSGSVKGLLEVADRDLYAAKAGGTVRRRDLLALQG